MEAREAIKAAKDYVGEVFASDGATNIGLEELRFDDHRGVWSVTIGFIRRWEGPHSVSRWATVGEPIPRTFKTVEIQDTGGKILGVKHWPVAA